MDDVSITTVTELGDPGLLDGVDALLECNGLSRDADIELFVIARSGTEVVGCMALAGDVVKCSVVDESLRGQNLLAPLLIELRYAALELGRPRLFVYTRPMYRAVFGGLGFRPLAEVPDLAVLMEDDPQGIERYQAQLAQTARAGDVIASVVVNANPFTLGHQHLIRCAADAADIVHVFVVGEDRSTFGYAERFALVAAGVAAMAEHDRIVVQPGSRYVVSNSTFPQYFLKEAADLSRAYTGIDLQLFRTYIAPVLGIRHRFVGTEPASAITATYNADMAYWLQEAPSPAPAIEVHEVPRIGVGTEPFISASRVRQLLAAGRLADLRGLVPPTTYDYLAGIQRDEQEHRKEWV